MNCCPGLKFFMLHWKFHLEISKYIPNNSASDKAFFKKYYFNEN